MVYGEQNDKAELSELQKNHNQYHVIPNKFRRISESMQEGETMKNSKCPRCGHISKTDMIYVGDKEGFICLDCARKEQHTDKPILNSDGSLAIIRHFYRT